MQLHDALHQVQAQPGPGLALAGAAAEVALEQAGQLVGGDAFAAVLYPDVQLTVVLALYREFDHGVVR